MRVLYYAHHHGSGHVHHARRFAALSGAENLIVGSSVASEPGSRRLPSDVVPGHVQPTGSPLHWTPTGPMIQERFAELHKALIRFDPDVVVVDVSVEAALFARLAGWPVIHRRMPGERTDAAHELLYTEADALVAWYPRELEDPAFLERFGDRATFTGVLAEPVAEAETLPGAGPKVGVLTSLGGDGVDGEQLARAAAGAPEWAWHVVGRVDDAEASSSSGWPENVMVHGVVHDPAPILAACDVVVVSAGHNAIALAAALRKPVIVIPEPRPFDEQGAWARRLGQIDGVQAAPSWNDVEDWNALLEVARASSSEALADAVLVSEDQYAAALREMLAPFGR